MLDLLKTTLPKKVQVSIHLAKDLPEISADLSQIQQVIMNLVINAGEAIGDNVGSLAIATGSQMCDESYLKRSRLEIKPPPGNFVFIEVSDTGCGMDTNTIQHLFEPFFTTKFTGRGLGLSAVLGIVTGHQGAMVS